MSNFRNYRGSQKRQIIDYNYILSLPDEKIIICISPQVLAIASNLLTTRGLWRSTYATEYLSGGYIIPTETEFEAIERIIAEGVYDMSTCSDIVSAINGLALTIAANSGGCSGSCGSGGAGSQPENYNPYDEGSVPVSPPYGSDFNAYRAQKCNIAAKLVEDLISDMVTVSQVLASEGTSTALATILVATLSSPIPFDEIVAMLAVVAYSGLAYLEFDAVADELNLLEDQMICALYNSNTSETAEAEWESVAHDAVDNAGFGSVATAGHRAVLDYFISSTATNRLFEDKPYNGIDHDCSACGCLTKYADQEGNYEDWPVYSGMGAISSYLTSGGYYIAYVSFNVSTDVTAISVAGYTAHPTIAKYRCGPNTCGNYAGESGLYNQDTVPGGGFIGVGGIAVTSTTPVTITSITFAES